MEQKTQTLWGCYSDFVKVLEVNAVVSLQLLVLGLQSRACPGPLIPHTLHLPEYSEAFPVVISSK